jgi:hypothetical protein
MYSQFISIPRNKLRKRGEILNLNGKYVGGSILISLGAAYILKNIYFATSFFWCSVGIFLFMVGGYSVTLAILKKEKTDTTINFLALFLGTSILLFVFSILGFSRTILSSTIFASFGLAYILSGCFFRYSTRNIFTGLILFGIALLLFLPFAFNISLKVYKIIKDYALGLALVIIGIIIFLGGKKKKTNEK